MKYRSVMNHTDSSAQYKRARKRVLEDEGHIKCGFCAYHRGDNGIRLQRSWKRYRKNRWRSVK